MGMNSELHGDDKIRHDEASAIQMIAMCLKSAREETKQILERTNDYRARVATMHITDAISKLDRLELEIVSGMEAIKKGINNVV